MSFKYIILNLLLLFVILMVGIKNYETWSYSFELERTGPEGVRKSETKPEIPSPMAPAKEPFSTRSYISIAEKNIFSPERKDFPIVGVEKSNPTARPQVILYGVTMAGDYQAASVVNPGRPLRKGERETMTVKIGEKIGEYKVAKVLPDRIALENNGDVFEVLLYDSRNPKKRVEVKTEVKPTVASTQPAPAPAPAAEAPKPPAHPVSAEKPKEPVLQQVGPVSPAPIPRPYFPSPSQRRGRRPVYTPPSTSTSETGGS